MMKPNIIHIQPNNKFWKHAVRNPSGSGFSCMFCPKNYPATDQPCVVAHVYHLAKIAASDGDNCPLVPIHIHDYMLRVWVPPMKASEVERFYQYDLIPGYSKHLLGTRIPIHMKKKKKKKKKKKAGVSTLQRPIRNRYSLRSHIKTEDLNIENMETNQFSENAHGPDEEAPSIGDDADARLQIENRLAKLESMLMAMSDKLDAFLDKFPTPTPPSHNAKALN